MTKQRGMLFAFGFVLLGGIAWWAGTSLGERLSAPDKEKHFQQQQEITQSILDQNQSIRIGAKWPDPLLQDLEGFWKRTSELLNDTTLLIIIRPGCDACEEELDLLNNVLSQEKYSKRAIIISDSYPLDLVQVKLARGLKCRMLVDRNRELFQQFNLIVFPMNILIAPDRSIISVSAGCLTEIEVEHIFH